MAARRGPAGRNALKCSACRENRGEHRRRETGGGGAGPGTDLVKGRQVEAHEEVGERWRPRHGRSTAGDHAEAHRVSFRGFRWYPVIESHGSSGASRQGYLHGPVPPADTEALLKSEERYRVLFELSPVAVYSIDASGVIQEFNRVAAELWGREPALGDTDERFCGSFKLFRPDGSLHAA